MLATLRFLVTHPLGGSAAVGRFLSWQVASRLLPGPFLLPFVGDTSLLVDSGMTGATGNWYCGLHEFEDMAFVLHALRAEDLFVDVGANIGSYTILAASTGSSVVSFEPVPSTFQHLERNIHVNRLSHLIDARNEGVAANPGCLPFTVGQDTVNHVLRPGETGDSIDVPVVTLDDALRGQQPQVIKIDVEGMETEVLAGAKQLMSGDAPLALVVEVNGSASAYGQSEGAFLEHLKKIGFKLCRYRPFERRISVLTPSEPLSLGSNVLLIRHEDEFQRRVESSPIRKIGSRSL